MSIQLVTFDLDNTLWDVHSVIRNAENMMRAWLTEHVPAVVALYESEGINEIREAVVRERAELLHDLSALRIEIVQRAIRHTGHSEPDARRLAERAFEVFYDGRHQVSYFPHALETLEALSQRYVLAALTNGNADIGRLGLDQFFRFGFSSADVGASKPAPDMFLAALKAAGVTADRAVHIGDHPRDDIAGAQSVGMHTILVQLDGNDPQPIDVAPSAQVQSLADLPETLTQLEARSLTN